MTKRSQLISTEDWIQLLTEEQRSKYSYAKAVYTGTDNLIEITCPLHGDFWQRAYLHKKRQCGCPQCYTPQRGASQRLTKSAFIEKAKEAHGDFYSYSNVAYKNNSTKVELSCPNHGSFMIMPSNHLAGKGCQKCYDDRRYMNQLSNTSDFVIKALKVSPEYDYTAVEYKNCKVKVKVICKKHGKFEITPDNLIQGQGCPACNTHGYSTAKPGKLYILSDGITTKVGITNKTPTDRSKSVYKTGGPKMDVIATFNFTDGCTPRLLEKQCISYLEPFYKRPDTTFDGSTECFLNVDIPALLAFVTPLAVQPSEIV